MSRVEINVAVVDDKRDDGNRLKAEVEERFEDTRVDVFLPDEIRDGDLAETDLLLVDNLLGEWPLVWLGTGGEARSVPPARRPYDGLALAAVLRSNMELLREDRPSAVALYTSQPETISAGLSPDVREHAIARIHNLEWVFDKSPEFAAPPLADRVHALARACHDLPGTWPDDANTAKEALREMLGWRAEMPGAELAWEEVIECRPPVHELAVASQGLAVLRWVAHRVLPYPCFLMNEHVLALRLGITDDAINEVVDDAASQLAAALASVRYEGVLEKFVGRLWWRAGVEQLTWDWTSGSADRAAATRERVVELAGRELAGLTARHPVVVIDESYAIQSEPAEIDDALRVAPDDWPPFADQAWTTIDRARGHPLLRSLVIPEDRHLLEQE
jgi:hypothetical protein